MNQNRSLRACASVWMLLLAALIPNSLASAQPSSYAFSNDPLARALQRQSVFVGRTRRTQVDARALQQVVHAAPPNMPVKIAVVTELPQQARVFVTRDAYTHALHVWLHLGRGLLIIETSRGVSASTSALSANQIRSILQQYAPEIQSNPTQGITHVVNSVLQAAQSNAQSANIATTRQEIPTSSLYPPSQAPLASTHSEFTNMLVIFIIAFLIIVFSVVAGAYSRASNKRRAQAAFRKRLEQLHHRVIQNLFYADNYLDLLPSSPEAEAAREARQQAAQLDAQAVQLLRTTNDPLNYQRAEALLQEAVQQAAICRQKIDEATGGTGVAVAVEGTDYRVTPANATPQAAPLIPNEDPEAIPPEERAVCFFCSRPARISELTPITIVLQGQRRKVLACPEDVRIVQQGSIPQVRTVLVDGKQVPWYAAPNYNPYHNYVAPNVSYAPLYTTSDGFYEGLLVGSLLSPPMPIAYPVFVDPIEVAPAPVFEPIFPDTTPMDVSTPDTGGTDWNPGPDFSSTAGSSGMDTGGVDFSNATNGSDFGGDTGGADFGLDTGGTDFGGSDFGGDGGADVGGGDFGGGDF